MISKLIINADDFGMCEGNSLGILYAHHYGVLTSTTIMMNMPYADFAIDKAKDYPQLGIGVHLNITKGYPLTPCMSLIENGNFKSRFSYQNKQVDGDHEEIYNEWKAQIDLYIQKADRYPTHLDSHHHVHMLEHLKPIALRLAKEYNIPLRERDYDFKDYPYIKCITTFDGRQTVDDFINILRNEEGIVEVMCHPAFIDQRLLDMSSYAIERAKELEVLRDPKLVNYIKDNYIELISYQNMKG